MPSTRERAVASAIELLGTQGLRALTHARVDEAAGLPPGSTSNSFRTRAALLEGVADEIVRIELSGVGEPEVPDTADDVIDLLSRTLELATGQGRVLTTARVVLFAEASHDERLRALLDRGRAAMEGWMAVLLRRFDVSDPAAAGAAMMACYEGLMLHRIARHDTTDPRPTFELVVRAALAR
jgi:DNA-binding transcriptional regulator YbjK